MAIIWEDVQVTRVCTTEWLATRPTCG